jgi:hypothetical protein
MNPSRTRPPSIPTSTPRRLCLPDFSSPSVFCLPDAALAFAEQAADSLASGLEQLG